MNFKDNLKRYRENAGFQANELAGIIGIPYTTYLNYENKGSEPKYDILCKIAAALHVSVDELLGYEGKAADWIEAKLKPSLKETIYHVETATDKEVTISCEFLAYDEKGNPISNDEETFEIKEIQKIFDEAAKSTNHISTAYIGGILSEKIGRLFLLKFMNSKNQ